MDLILRRGTQLFGIEGKRSDSPRMMSAVRHVFVDLGLTKVAIIYPGKKRIPGGDKTEAVPMRSLAWGEPLFGE